MGWMVERPVLASSEARAATPALLAGILDGYAPEEFYDEAFAAPGRPRAHYRTLVRTLGSMTAREVGERRLRLDRAFMNQGVTFTVYKDDAGIERIFPFDPMPRIVTRRKWERVEAGRKQRVFARDAFVHGSY